MKSWVEAISLVGSTLRVAAPGPVPAERDTIAVASAIRVFARFQALDVRARDAHVCVAARENQSVERLLEPEGFAALRDRGRWPQVLARALQRRAAARLAGAA